MLPLALIGVCPELLATLPFDKEGKPMLKNGVLTFSIEVTLSKSSHLYWYYQPEPNLITPMRMLNQGGLDKRATIGMKDGKIL